MLSLEDYLQRRILSKGPIPISEYMQACLTHPKFGYYMGEHIFGEEGDFVTSPEISQMFGELLGVWVVSQWELMGKPKHFYLIELGPGRGTLLADLMRVVKSQKGLKDAIRLYLVELSPKLRELQKSVLSCYNPTWSYQLDQIPHGPTLLIANEFFDALPIRQFQRVKAGWHERLIGLGDRKQHLFEFVLSRFPSAINLERFFPKALEGSIIEVSSSSNFYLRAISQRLIAYSGSALIFDYGYIEDKLVDTFQAVKNHKYTSVLKNPGQSDLSAHVNFTTLKKIGEEISLGRVEVVTQREFLYTYGIEDRVKSLIDTATREQVSNILLAHQRLTGLNQMGELFKVLILENREVE